MKSLGLDWEDFELKLFAQPGFKEAQEKTRLEYEITRALIKARIEKQQYMPCSTFLKRLAKVLDASLEIHFRV